MCSNFENPHDFSLETFRLALRNKIESSNKLINMINLKLTKSQNVIWLSKMAKLIQILMQHNVELIFFVELSIISNISKIYG